LKHSKAITHHTFEGSVLRYARALRMERACVECHNNHPKSPKRDWQVGDVGEVLEIIRPLHNDERQIRDGLWETFVLVATIAVVLLGLGGVVLFVGRRRSTLPSGPFSGSVPPGAAETGRRGANAADS
jgi:hypothetical protein